MQARPESDFPTILQLRDRLSELIENGFGALPVQVVVVPDSTLQALAQGVGGALPGAPPALMIDLVDASDAGSLPVGLISADRLAGRGMMSRTHQQPQEGAVSNRTLVELNHDFCPGRSTQALAEWAAKMARYIGSGDKRDLPDGVTFKHMRHHSDPDPMAGHGDPS